MDNKSIKKLAAERRVFPCKIRAYPRGAVIVNAFIKCVYYKGVYYKWEETDGVNMHEKYCDIFKKEYFE